MTTNTYEIAYRTGGTLNAVWHPVLGHFDAETCATKRAEIERMGYKTVAHRAGWIAVIGLPIGYGPAA